MLPGKKYTPEDYLWAAWARRWVIVLPTVLAAAGTFIYAYQLPNRYRSTSTVQITPQRVPENYVRSTVTADVSERLQTISQQILSRTRLEAIITEFNLYEDDRKAMIMEDVIEQMRNRDINIDVAVPRRRDQDASSFTVSFNYSNPRTAMRVAERVASLFVKENMEERELLADSTNQFLQSELEDKKRRLLEYEQRLEAFRSRNAGRLPSQAQSNLQLLQSTQAQIQANADAANRERERLQAIDSNIADLLNTAPAVNQKTVASAPGGSVIQQLEAARIGLTNLRLKMTDEHPEVRQAVRLVKELEAKAEAEALDAPTPLDPSEAVRGVTANVAARITALRSEAQEIRARLENRKETEARLQKSLGAYSTRIEAAPMLESEQTELMRDYTTLREQYDGLVRKSEESKIAVNLERRQIGEQFRILDGARLPERPFSPDRVQLNLMGLLGGLGLGLGLAALLEYRDTTLKTDGDIVASLALPVLAVIPAMTNGAERATRKRRKQWTLVAASATGMVLLMVAVAWKYRVIQDLVR